MESLIQLGPLHTVFLSPSNTSLVTVNNTLMGTEERSLHLDTVSEVPVSLDMVGEVLMLGYRDRITLWDLRTSRIITVLLLRSCGITSSLVAIRANATTLAAMVTSGVMCMWNLMDIIRAHLGGLSAGSPEFSVLETQDLPYRNRMELTEHRVVFGSEKTLGDFYIISSSSNFT